MVIARIAAAIGNVPGVAVLDRSLDPDHNRAVVTFAGDPAGIAEAALAGIEQAVALIDLNRHQGVHPRMGAADVVPFVPVSGVTLKDCVSIARNVGEQVWRRFHVPVYLYEAAARRPERANLANIRRGQFEKLRDEVRADAERLPDFGGAELHPTAGACVVGARNFLIAFNINLATDEVAIARRIARKIRFSAGGLPYVKALGLLLSSRNQAQVSTNLIDFEQTSLSTVFEAVRAEAGRCGVEIASSQIVGLVPRRALDMAAGCDLRLENFHPGLILENRLAKLLGHTG